MKRRDFLTKSVLAGGAVLFGSQLFASAIEIPTYVHIRHGLLLNNADKVWTSIQLGETTYKLCKDVFLENGADDQIGMQLFTFIDPSGQTTEVFVEENTIVSEGISPKMKNFVQKHL